MQLLRANFRNERGSFWCANIPLPLLWTVWTGNYPAPQIQTQKTRDQEEEEPMARRKLTLEDQLRGVRGAIRSPKTPPQLKPGLRKRAATIEKRLGRRNKKKADSGLLGLGVMGL